MNNIKITLTLGNIMLKNSTLKSSQHSQYCCIMLSSRKHLTLATVYYPAVSFSHSFPSLMLQQTMSDFKVHQRDSHAPHAHADGSSNIFKVCL